MSNSSKASVNNIYQLDGKVPLSKATPFGLQHVLAMFIAGIATLIQLYPIWKIGARLPIVMGVSFTFATILSSVGARSFGGGYSENFGSVTNLLIGTFTLLCCILFNVLAKSFWKQLSGSLCCNGFSSSISSLFGCIVHHNHS